MSKRDDYIAFISEFKTISPTITDEQRKGLLRRAVQQHGISVDDADEILNASGITIGEKIDYFDILGFAIEDLHNQSESDIGPQVDDAHSRLYTASLNAGARVRPDGSTEEQWRALLNQARDILKDAQKRQAHILMLQTDVLTLPETLSDLELSPSEQAVSSKAIVVDQPQEIDLDSRGSESTSDATFSSTTIFQRINSFLGKIENGLLCLIIAMMIGLAVLEIVLRYGFKTSFLWKHLLLQNLTLWMCFLGAALASSERRHISIDALNRILPTNISRYTGYIIDVLSLIVVGILAYFGFDFLIEEQKSPATIGIIPMWWVKTIIPFGFVLIGIHLILQICIKLTGKDQLMEDAEGEPE